jgi:hypothetical protein
MSWSVFAARRRLEGVGGDLLGTSVELTAVAGHVGRNTPGRSGPSEGTRDRSTARVASRPVPQAHVDALLRPDDLVFAVCDNAHEELGARASGRLHWSVPDPVRVGTDDAFEHALALIEVRVSRLAPAVTTPAEMS